MTLSIKGEGIDLELSEEELVARLTSAVAKPGQMLVPEGIRYYERVYTKYGEAWREAVIVVVESPPGLKKVSYKASFDGGGSARIKTDDVSTPYIVNVYLFWVHNANGSDAITLDTHWPMTFYGKYPITDLKSELFVANLPNVRTDPWNDCGNRSAFGWTCYVGSGVPLPPKKKGLSGVSLACEYSKKLVGYLFSSTFTTSAGSFTAFTETSKALPEVKTIAEWAARSKDNPYFGLTVDWLPHPKGWNLGRVIASMKREMKLVGAEAFDKQRAEMSPATLKAALSKRWPKGVSRI